MPASSVFFKYKSSLLFFLLCFLGLGFDGTLSFVEAQAANNIRLSCGSGTASDAGGTNPPGEGPEKAFDGTTSTKWLLDNGGSGGWTLKYDFGAQRHLTFYYIFSGNDFFERDPYSWTLYGSNDNVNYYTIESRSGITWASTQRNTPKQFNLVSGVTYRFFRLNISQIRGPGNMCQLSELEYFGFCNAPTPQPTPQPTRPPTRQPTPQPTPAPVTPSPTPAVPTIVAQNQGQQGGTGGDPHIFPWNGNRFDFHGHCDLVLLQNEAYQNGKGLSIHIRSSPFKTIFSYISSAVVKIGDIVFQVDGLGRYYMNGQAYSASSTSALAINQNLRGGADFQVDIKHDKAITDYTIYLHNGTLIFIRDQRRWLRVVVRNALPQDFASSTGLMGSFADGTWYGRDGVTVFDEHTINDFGMEWQVREELDGLLFQTPSPFPDKCDLPIAMPQETRRRLTGSSVSDEEAAAACSTWGDQFQDCVFDVMVSQDLRMAELGPIV